MTIKFLHIRAVDPELCEEDGVDIILPTGGLTVAYTCTKKDVMVQVAKCREQPIIVTEKKARKEALFDAILLDFKNSSRHDAAKLMEIRAKLSRIERMPVFAYDLFCYKIGRERAVKALKDRGPLEILPLEHPVSWTIADWVANSLWPLGTEVFGYKGADMGFNIDIWRDKKGRWLSDFVPSEGTVVMDCPNNIPDENDLIDS